VSDYTFTAVARPEPFGVAFSTAKISPKVRLHFRSLKG